MKKGLILIVVLLCFNCSDDDSGYQPTPSPLEIPEIFSTNIIPPVIPSDNPQTVEGIALGKKLFFDRILSADGTQSCASCHSPQKAFAENLQTSVGIDGISGPRNAMPLFNLAWNYGERFNWDGSALSLER